LQNIIAKQEKKVYHNSTRPVPSYIYAKLEMIFCYDKHCNITTVTMNNKKEKKIKTPKEINCYWLAAIFAVNTCIVRQ
jgi:hypothetical protein